MVNVVTNGPYVAFATFRCERHCLNSLSSATTIGTATGANNGV